MSGPKIIPSNGARGDLLRINLPADLDGDSLVILPRGYYVPGCEVIDRVNAVALIDFARHIVADYEGRPDAALDVLAECRAESHRTEENMGDEATAADYAADIVRQLNRTYLGVTEDDTTPWCPRHGGSWGSDATCPECTDSTGQPRAVDVDDLTSDDEPESDDERDMRETGPDGDARTYDPETGAKIEPPLTVEDRTERTIYRVTAADCDAIAGRTLNDDELRIVADGIGLDGIGEYVADAVDHAMDDDDEDEA